MATEDNKTPQAETAPAPADPSASDTPEAVSESTSETTDATIVQCASLFLNVRRLLFMSLGALALTADEARDFVERLAERGDLPQGVAQEEVERWVDDLHLRHPDLAVDGYRNGGDGPVDALWGRLRVPTRREIEALSRKISALDQKLAALRAKRTPGSPVPSTDAAPPEA